MGSGEICKGNPPGLIVWKKGEKNFRLNDDGWVLMALVLTEAHKSGIGWDNPPPPINRWVTHTTKVYNTERRRPNSPVCCLLTVAPLYTFFFSWRIFFLPLGCWQQKWLINNSEILMFPWKRICSFQMTEFYCHDIFVVYGEK